MRTKEKRSRGWRWAVWGSAIIAAFGCGSRSEVSDRAFVGPGSSQNEASADIDPIVCGSPPTDCGEDSCPTIVDIEMGGDHACALMSNGSLRCWGSNYFRQLGAMDGRWGVQWPAPRELAGVSDVVEVALGGWHTCMRFVDGTVTCWGGESDFFLSPELDSVTQLALGGRHACALSKAGKVQCWGSNRSGELGIGSISTKADKPVSVKGLGKVRKIALGYAHSCALVENGAVLCWGSNSAGQVGTGAIGEGESEPLPMLVPWLSGVVDISLGEEHSCALLEDGTARCWGRNEEGALGNGSFEPREEATLVQGLSAIAQISSGSAHNCALLDDGTVRCWGRNTSRQLGNEKKLTNDAVPFPVPGLSRVRKVALGYEHSCALLEDASVCCWGDNHYGQIGDGKSTGKPGEAAPKPTPVKW